MPFVSLRSLAISLSIFLGLASSLSTQAQPFVFTAIPDQDETRLKERFDKVAVWLQNQLGTEVKYVPVKDYAATVSAFRNNQVQLAWFGGLSGVQARQLVPGSKAIAQGIEDPEFITYFIANNATGLKHSAEFPAAIEGKRFAFGSKSSTSGRLMPEFYIRKHLGKTPEEAFSKVGFSGDHSRTIALVESGAYEVGAVNYQVWSSGLADGSFDKERLRVIWETPPYPDYQWTIRGDVDKSFGKGFTEKVRTALLEMKDPDLLATFPRTGFIPASNEEFEPILRTAEELGLID